MYFLHFTLRKITKPKNLKPGSQIQTFQVSNSVIFYNDPSSIFLIFANKKIPSELVCVQNIYKKSFILNIFIWSKITQLTPSIEAVHVQETNIHFQWELFQWNSLKNLMLYKQLSSFHQFVGMKQTNCPACSLALLI